MTQPFFHWQDLPAAMGLMSRIPVRVDPEHAALRSARATWAYPVAGALIGALAGVVALGISAIGLPPLVQAIAALTTSVILTGAMHEDGLADSADGLWGGWTPERRLEIMKDSRTGAYGVIAIALSLLWRVTLLSLVLESAHPVVVLAGLGALSRSAMSPLMAFLPQARKNGLSSSVGSPTKPTALTSAATGLAIALPLLGPIPCLAAAAIAALWATIALRKIGGQTGDILGASQQLTEIAALIALAALLPSSL
ncbi:adenosylcobinamide-GDP ribazoletransferase [Donghicola mangrovi]|uniref:Adenosylcobinamide-GDP ribazoletransferase n=1 Tax=Donghicola mangrovi TaxID=2729614 RepID=A0A850QFG2_9RHOB|nr:adenosylcobinamide-GDP ribazoletransferase [Donghicola mangrovi]NVO24849.1 adenosylcobinamide-GDP ribazoletransferase [Donghicola mangrovi]